MTLQEMQLQMMREWTSHWEAALYRSLCMASDGKKGPLAGGPKKGVKEGTRTIKSKKGAAASTKVTDKGKNR